MSVEQTALPRSRWPFKRRFSAWMLGGVIAALVVWGRFTPTAARNTQAAAPVDRSAATPREGSEPTAEPLLNLAADPAAAVQSPAAVVDWKSQLLGSWSDNFYGKRIFTFRDDGTAEMTIELDSVGKALYGPQLKFFIAWEVRDDILHMQMTGGEPAGSAVTLAKLFGEKSEQRIEKLEADEMLLRSLDSQKLYSHRRVATRQ